MTLSQKAMRKVISGVGWSNPLTHNVYLDTASYLKVYSDDIELVLGDDYTVDELQNEAGYEVTIASFAPGMEPAWYFPDVWVLSVEPPIDQAQDVSLGGSFGARYEVALDALARRLQRVYDMALRAIKSPRTTDPGALDQDDLEIDPDVIPALVEASDAAIAAADAAEASAAAALASENAADADADQVATDRAVVAADKATVAADKATVAADKATVAADKATVAADKGIVSGYRDDVEADRVEVSTNTTTASDAAVAAAAAQAAAEAALASTLSAFDSFDDRYLGAKAVAPVLDNDGNALAAGALYYDTVIAAMFVYTGSAWAAAYVDGTTVLLKAQNLNDLPDKPTARTNLSVYSIAQIDAMPGSVASKTTPVDADSWTIWDSVASAWKRVTGTNLKAYLKTYFDTLYQALDSDLTAIAALAPSNDDVVQRKAGAWSNRTIAQLLADLAAPGTTFQPLDADLTALAALATNAAGRSILTLSDPNADRLAFWDDSAGAYQHLTLGTNLTITGTTIDAAGGGDIEYVGKQTAAGAASILFDSSTTGALAANYDYIVVLDKIQASADTQVSIQYGTGAGPTYQTTGYTSRAGSAQDTITTGLPTNDGSPGGASANESVSGEFTILEVGANERHPANGLFFGFDSSGNRRNTSVSGWRTTSEVLTGLRIIPGSGTITGVARLYRRSTT